VQCTDPSAHRDKRLAVITRQPNVG
jgi:hypothetical protein